MLEYDTNKGKRGKKIFVFVKKHQINKRFSNIRRKEMHHKYPMDQRRYIAPVHDYCVIGHVQHAWKGGKSAYKMVYRCTFNGLGHILDTFISVIQTKNLSNNIRYHQYRTKRRGVGIFHFNRTCVFRPLLFEYSTLPYIQLFGLFILNFIAWWVYNNNFYFWCATALPLTILTMIQRHGIP